MRCGNTDFPPAYYCLPSLTQAIEGGGGGATRFKAFGLREKFFHIEFFRPVEQTIDRALRENQYCAARRRG